MANTTHETQFPVVYEDREIRVFHNPSREIFIEDIESGVKMRLSSCHGGLTFTNWSGTPSRVEPIRVANGIGWRVRAR